MAIYLDNAATTRLRPQVVEAMMPFLQENFGNPSSIHTHGRRARVAVEAARRTIAQILKVHPSRIIFTSGATEAANTIIYSLALEGYVKGIVTTAVEHPCILEATRWTEQLLRLPTATIPVDELGRIKLEELHKTLAHLPAPALVCVIHGNNEIATINPVEQIAEICLRRGALLLVDMVQTVGHYELTLNEIKGINYIIASAHKFHGPKGVGFFYCREGAPVPALLRGGAQERGIRAGTENVAGIVGMAEALRLQMENLDSEKKHIWQLKQNMMTLIKQHIPEATFNGDHSPTGGLYHVLNVSLPEVMGTSELVLMHLDIEGICASAGSACTSGAHRHSHVLEALGIGKNVPVVRFSFAYYNTREEVGKTVATLKKIYQEACQKESRTPLA